MEMVETLLLDDAWALSEEDDAQSSPLQELVEDMANSTISCSSNYNAQCPHPPTPIAITTTLR